MTTNTSSLSPPDGFQVHHSPSPFVQSLGPMYKRVCDDGTAVIAIRVQEGHLNMHGIAHGGWVATLIDNALGYNVVHAIGGPIVTAHLAVDYLSSARLGDWVEATVRLTRKGRRMCFAECTLATGDVLVARATCIMVPV